ncbi:mediator complex subunit 25 von willebrand factor type A domain-containing protein [Phthorimaea operculella]|nr:mediator complex subunit 25 von willebrand factor type A domain-containing protein [Phthorimaea operculella]
MLKWKTLKMLGKPIAKSHERRLASPESAIPSKKKTRRYFKSKRGVPATVEACARALSERGAMLSVFCARRVPALAALYEHAGTEHAHQPRNYAKDPRHLVLLRGFSLKERPPSPAPPPVPEIQTDVYGGGRGAPPAPRPPAPPFPRTQTPRSNWLAPPPRQPLYGANSALLTQLAQPSYPPPAQRLPSMLSQPGPSTSPAAPAPLQRAYIWSGVLEWMEKGKAPGDQQKVTRLLPCQHAIAARAVHLTGRARAPTTRVHLKRGSGVDGEGEGTRGPAEGHQAAALPGGL